MKIKLGVGKVSGPVDMRGLIERAHRLVSKFGAEARELSPGLDAYRKRMQKEPGPARKLVSAQDTAVELGPPDRLSVNAVLWTREKKLVRDNRFCLVGPDLAEAAGTAHAYAQVICLAVKESGADALGLEALQYFPELLPGLMARMVPGRLWLRASKNAVAAGLNFSLLAAAVRAAYQKELPQVLGVESIFVTRGRSEVEPFAAIASEAKILAGKHRRIALSEDGGYECAELDCRNCEEKPVCDMIREVRKIRRREKL